MATYILVPGAFHGGWWFGPVTDELRRHGHRVFPVSLAGVGSHDPVADDSVNLDTHIDEVVALIESEQLSEIVLCAHSYGGMVITGVADRIPERVAALVYLDAAVPVDGDSMWKITSDHSRRLLVEAAANTGFSFDPPPGIDGDPRVSSHPVATYFQALRVRGGVDSIRRKIFVYCSEFRETPYRPVYERLRQRDDWTVHRLASGHDVMADAPSEVVTVLLEVPLSGCR